MARRERKEANKGVYFIYVQYIIYVYVILTYTCVYEQIYVQYIFIIVCLDREADREVCNMFYVGL